MTDSSLSLFTPVQVGPYKLHNRIVMAPMARARSDADRAPTDLVPIYYAQRASAGLLVTEATHISPDSVSGRGTSAIHTEPQVQAWRRVTEAVHAAGGLIFQQIYHLGRKQHQSFLPGGCPPIAPSAIAANGKVTTADGPQPFSVPRALETDEIPKIVAQFRQGALNSIRAGFDGVEIHAANAYLIDQFLRDGTNKRTDKYGGSIENRARFLIEIIEACGGAIGMNRVGVRFSPHFCFDGISDSNPVALFSYLASRLDELGVAYLHLVEGLARGTPVGPAADGTPLLPILRKLFTGPLILNGEYTLQTATEAIASGQADLVSFGELFISNPDLPRRFELGAPLAVPNPATYRGGGAEGYIDYPTLDEN
jgi:N-ethylmaleimide reductase